MDHLDRDVPDIYALAPCSLIADDMSTNPAEFFPAPSAPPQITEKAEVVPGKAEVFPGGPKVFPGKAEVFPGKVEVLPEKAERVAYAQMSPRKRGRPLAPIIIKPEEPSEEREAPPRSKKVRLCILFIWARQFI